MIGNSSEVEASYFNKIPDMSALSLVAGDSEMQLSWETLSGFDMPVKDLKYDVLMNGSVVEFGLEGVSYLKSGLVNGVVNEFVVKASFYLVEDDYRTFTSETEPVSLSAYKAPDAPTGLTVSNLASSSLT